MQLAHCGEDEHLEEECVQELMTFTREVIYGDTTSTNMGEARAKKWRSQKKKNFCRLPPDEDCLRQHITRANYLAYLQRNPLLMNHPSPIGNGWELVKGFCRPIGYAKPPLPAYLSGPGEGRQDVNNNDTVEITEIKQDENNNGIEELFENEQDINNNDET